MAGVLPSQDVDPWSLIVNGDCSDRRFAYVTLCITQSEHILATCLASLCALLSTTDPSCVVAIVNSWVYTAARAVLVASGVVPYLAPEWAPLPQEHPYSHLQLRNYTFSKFEAFRFTQYKRVAFFDADVLFIRNASGLEMVTPSDAFAATRILRGARPEQYINTGVMVLKPSFSIYNDLVLAWRQGDYLLQFPDGDTAENTEQDVVITVCVERASCGAFVDLDPCVYNYGSSLSSKLGRQCLRSGVIGRHNFASTREPMLSATLEAAMRRGSCRPRSGITTDACWTDGFSRDSCCRGTFGNPHCWGTGLSFERCCRGIHDAPMLQRDLLRVGMSWYGLSSVPDKPPASWFAGICLQKYRLWSATFASTSSVMTTPPGEEWYPWNVWSSRGPPPWYVALGEKCKGLRAPHLREEIGAFIVFRVNFRAYIARHPTHPVVSSIANFYKNSHLFQLHTDAMTTCVPHECCMLQPTGANASLVALHSVLWHFFSRFVLEVSQAETIPPPSAADFTDIYSIDPQNPSGQSWIECHA
eukprot:TRINITY_DN28197_c0_g1_i1.p1 TRINITY_DN28197_c0_g1~~TRINITY_DN28197_c0_g1_i1.p1  ORF type:complete len:555 (-),score=51.23 TRINITY_DN28197_c0_g1_i1:145-1734(-)